MPLRSFRVGTRCSIAAALALMFGGATLQAAKAAGETRTISFHHAHTNENLTVTYKVNGRYDEEALKKINYVLRDWREAQPIKMDPELIDLLWEVHRETGSREPIWVVCGYRSPETNTMLRKRSRGVAQHSQHMLGKAVDFFIPGVSVDEMRAAGLRAQRGGVGYYPSSNFVHLDTGSVRHWPRMPDAQLAKVLAKGQLASHNASDNGSVSRVNVAQAEITRSEPPNGMQAFLSKLFGSNGEDHENEAEAAPTQAQVATAQAAATGTEACPRRDDRTRVRQGRCVRQVCYARQDCHVVRQAGGGRRGRAAPRKDWRHSGGAAEAGEARDLSGRVRRFGTGQARGLRDGVRVVDAGRDG